MGALKEQYVTDGNGKKTAVILPIKAYEKLLEDREELEDQALYDKVKLEDDGERIPFSEYQRKRKAKRA